MASIRSDRDVDKVNKTGSRMGQRHTLLTLPPEIRAQILSYVFRSVRLQPISGIILAPKKDTSGDQPDTDTVEDRSLLTRFSVLLCCKMLRTEALTALYKEAVFQPFVLTDALRMKTLGPIRKLRVFAINITTWYLQEERASLPPISIADSPTASEAVWTAFVKKFNVDQRDEIIIDNHRRSWRCHLNPQANNPILMKMAYNHKSSCRIILCIQAWSLKLGSARIYICPGQKIVLEDFQPPQDEEGSRTLLLKQVVRFYVDMDYTDFAISYE